MAARALKDFHFGPASLDAAWKTVLLHQFHDALPGSWINRVYQEIERDYEVVISQARILAVQAAGKLVSSAAAATVFNSLSWPRKALVALPEGITPGGPHQKVAIRPWLKSTCQPVAGLLYRKTGAVPTNGGIGDGNQPVDGKQRRRVQFNDLGEISSLMDKRLDARWPPGHATPSRCTKTCPPGSMPGILIRNISIRQ